LNRKQRRTLCPKSKPSAESQESPHENWNHRRWKHWKDTCAPPRQARTSGPHCELERTGEPDRVGGRDRRDAISVLDAAKAGEIVIIAIPTKAVADLPWGLFANVPSSVVVIDIGNYHPELRDGRIDAIDLGMLDSQWVAQQIGRPVIKVFNNIYAKSLLEKGVPRGTNGRIALSVFGDSLDAKAAVLRLVDDLGFDPVDGGDLDNSWRQQPGTPAYCQDLESTILRRALTEAVRSRIAEYRAEEEARIRRSIAAQATKG
jgi:predicted dinucleotide-binding enzyme